MRKGSADIKFYSIARTFDLVGNLIKYGFFIWLASYAIKAIDILSDKTTIIDVAVSYITSSDSDYSLPWIVTTIAMAYAIFERNLRKRKVRELHADNVKLELQINPDKQSSTLLSTGETNPEDKL